MKVGDLIMSKDGYHTALVVSIVGAAAFNRIKVLVVGSDTPEMCDPRMWEVISG